MKGTFDGMHAVVSGASGTIGSAIARRIVDEGGTVTVIGRGKDPLQKLVGKLGEHASFALVDVDSDEDVAEFAATLDRVDVLVCTAGWTVVGPVEKTPVADAIAMFSARFFGQCRLIKSTLPKLADGGLILMCSGVGNTSFYPHYPFGASVAAAIEAYAHHIAGELAPRKIRVNVISPGWTVADEIDGHQPASSSRMFLSAEEQAAFRAALDSPMHETISPEEFADALVFMVRSKHFTGQVVRLDAGRSVTDKPLDGHVNPSSFSPR